MEQVDIAVIGAGPAGSSAAAWAAYQAVLRKEYDPFFATARRFAWLIGRPKLLQFLLGIALSTNFTMKLVLDIMANLVDMEHPGLAGRSLTIGGKALSLADPLLVRSSAKDKDKRATPVG